jgi:EpsI family protein
MKLSSSVLNASVAAILIVCAALAAHAMTPRQYLSNQRAALNLDRVLPTEFGTWRLDQQAPGLVNPELNEALSRIYTQMVSRTYVNDKGERVMLAVTYGPDQRADRAVHYPEICYPAQGFRIASNHAGSIDIGENRVSVRRLETNYNNTRMEPVTYWTTIGDYTSVGGFRKRLLELRYGLSGIVPDGILFRVSSIGADSSKEFDRQNRFTKELLLTVRSEDRTLLTGKPAP